MPLHDPSNDDSLQTLIAEVLEIENRGEPVDREALIARHPEHADSIREFFTRHDQKESATAPGAAPTIASGLIPADDLTLPPHRSSADEPTIASSSAATPNPQPTIGDNIRYFGDYELLEEIARGGMGVVYKARQVNLNRIVALKMILAGQFAGQEDVQRFYTEAEAAAQLDHPGIVPIFEIGEHAGQHYFSMGYIEGRSLADRIAEGPLPCNEAASLLAKICEAMAYAHQRGVIHRDLKPANILLDADGQPKVTDFGLAKRTETDSGLTGTGQILGTPSYMPPEQASGKVEEVGPLADVYSLGAILYSTLTGRPPFQAASPMDTLLQVLEKDPIAPRQLNPALDEDLQTICLKSLEKQPERRYSSAQELWEELQRYLNGEPIVARPIGRIERAWRWCKRKPALAGACALAAILLLVLSVGGPAIAIQQAEFASEQVTLKGEAESARDQAESRRQEAEASRAEAVAAQRKVELEQERVGGLLYSTRISLAYREWLDCNPTRMQQLLNECPDEKRNWEWHYLDQMIRAEKMSIFAHGYPASAQFLPGGKTLLTRGGRDNQFKLWDVATGLEEDSHHVPRLRSVSAPLDGEHFLVVQGNAVTYVGSNPREIETFGDFGVAATSGRLFADGTRVAASFDDGTIALYERPGGKEIHRTPKKLKSARPHVFAPNGRVVAGTDSLTVKVWDVRTGETVLEVEGHGLAIEDIEFSSDGSMLASVDRAGGLIVTDIRSGQRLHHIHAHTAGAQAVAFSSDGKRIATASMDRTSRIFDVVTGDQLLTIRGHTGSITDVGFDPSGDQLVTASVDGTARVWQIRNRLNATPEVLENLATRNVSHKGHSPGLESTIYYSDMDSVYDVVFSRDGHFAASSSFVPQDSAGKHLIKVWSLADSSLYATFPVPGGLLHTLCFSGDGKYLIVASGGAGDAVSPASVNVWDMESKERFRSLDGIACMLTRVALNKDNDILGVAYGNLNYGKLRSYSFPDCELLHELDVKGERLSAIAFSASGDELLSTSTPGGRVRIWNSRTGEESEGFVAHGTGVFQIAVSADDVLATASVDNEIGIWDWRNRKKLGDLKGHSVYAVDVAFSPDGKRLVSSSEDETVKIWDLSSYSELLSFRDHTAPALGVDWSADGRMIASTSRDGAMIIRGLGDNRDIEPVEDWVTVFQDDFEREELGPDWSGSGWKIEDGKVVGTLQPVTTSGSSFPGAFLSLSGIEVPRSVEVTADISLRQAMLAQIVLSNRRTTQYIAPFIASTTIPYNFIGSMVQVARGEGEQNRMLGGRSEAKLEPGETYRLRVVREIDHLKFYLDGRLLEHVRVPTLEADGVLLSGCFSQLNDQIEFDNVVVRIPKQAVRQQEIRKQVGAWLTTMLIPELVEEKIAEDYRDPQERELADTMLKRLAAASDPTPPQIVNAFNAVAMRSDATPQEYEIAMRQAEFYIGQGPDRWQMGKVGLALLRGGKPEEALAMFDRGIEENMAESGHAFGLLYAGRALALHELGRDDEAKIAHGGFRDSNWTHLGNTNPMPRLTEELQTKVPIEDDSLRKTLVDMLLSRDKALWFGRNVKRAYRDTAPDYASVLGRGPEPDQYDVIHDRASAMKLDAIHSISSPPPRVQLLWEQIQVDRPTVDSAILRWVTISKFEGIILRFGKKYEFLQTDQQWKIVSGRSWQIDQRINNQWSRHDTEHWTQLDERIDKLKATDDPALARALLNAMRFEEALQLSSEIAKQMPHDADNLAFLGEAAVTLGKFQEGSDALMQARLTQPSVQMPWFLTRVMRVFADHEPNPFDLDFHPTRPVMVTAHQDRALVLWDLDQKKILHTIRSAHGREATGAVFSKDGSKIFSVGWDTALNIFDVEAAQRTGQLTGHLNLIYRIERHPDKDIVVTAAGDGTAKIWDLTERRELVTLSGHSQAVLGASFSPDGEKVATAGSDGTVRIWNAVSGRELGRIEAHQRGAWRVDWVPDGSRLVSCGRDGLVCVWDAETYQQIAALKGHASEIEVVRVSPDGKLAASADVAGEIWVWDLETFQPVGVLRDGGANYNLRFHDGSLYSAGADITQWDIDFTRSPLTEALRRATE